MQTDGTLALETAEADKAEGQTKKKVGIFPVWLAEKITLHYYNDYLRDHGVISQREWLAMYHLIEKEMKKKEPKQKQEGTGPHDGE